MNITPHIYYSLLYFMIKHITPHRGLFCQNVRKNFVTTKSWYIFKLSHPTVMGGRSETMRNQITFIFSKE